MKQYIENMDDEVRCGHLVTSQTKRIWNLELHIAQKLIDVCKKYNLRLWADGGTLLGAIRHQGFIPWDDDMDFVIPRKDFEVLRKVASQEFQYPFFFQYHDTDKYFFGSFAKIRYEESCMMDMHEAEYPTPRHMGLLIDLFVLDEVPDSEVRIMDMFNNINLMHSYMRHRTEWKYLILPHRLLGFLSEAIKLKGKTFWSNTQINNYIDAQLINFGDGSGLWSMVSYSGKPHLIRPEQLHSETTYMPFEKIMVPVMNGYDTILRNYYGDYAVPVKGTQAHVTQIIDADRSYKEYVKDIRVNYLKMFYNSVKQVMNIFTKRN